jgi:hypothetical protein
MIEVDVAPLAMYFTIDLVDLVYSCLETLI